MLGLDYVTVDRSSGLWVLTGHFVPNAAVAQTDTHLSRLHEVTIDHVSVLAEGRPVPGLRITAVRHEVGSSTKPVISVSLQQLAPAAETADLELPTYDLALSGLDGVDPFFDSVPFRLKESPSLLPRPVDAPLAAPPSPLPDYTARSYEAYRSAMLDHMSVRVTGWADRDPADLGVTLVESLAAAADYLSYYQAAVATESYLDTARRRVSLRRHGQLRDAELQEGRNARTLVQVAITTDGGKPIVLDAGTPFVVFMRSLPRVIDPQDFQRLVPLDRIVFESVLPTSIGVPELGSAPQGAVPGLYDWRAPDFWLEEGATEAYLLGNYANLAAGSFVVFAQRVSPTTGREADADPRCRHAVRLIAPPEQRIDPLFGYQLTYIQWSADDALPFAVAVSTVLDGHPILNITATFTNCVLADAGRTMQETQAVTDPFGRVRLSKPDLTFHAPAPALLDSARKVLDDDVRSTMPAISVFERDCEFTEVSPGNIDDPDADTPLRAQWLPRVSLMDSSPFSRVFVVEMDEARTANLRFGDGAYGRTPRSLQNLKISYRVGNGPDGNVGAERLAHIVTDQLTVAQVSGVSNPVPALGGLLQEGLASFRRKAATMLSRELRCVTEADFVARVLEHPEVRDASAALRWAGSFTTMSLFVDRVGGKPVDKAFRTALENWIGAYRIAGVGLEVRSPRRVPVILSMTITVGAGQSATAVEALVTRELVDMFDDRSPDRFVRFGATLYLSRVVRRLVDLQGVADVSVSRFQRLSDPSTRPRINARLTMSSSEIAELRNDMDAPQLGRVQLALEGGR